MVPAGVVPDGVVVMAIVEAMGVAVGGVMGVAVGGTVGVVLSGAVAMDVGVGIGIAPVIICTHSAVVLNRLQCGKLGGSVACGLQVDGRATKGQSVTSTSPKVVSGAIDRLGSRPAVDKVEVESVTELDVECRFGIGLGSGMRPAVDKVEVESVTELDMECKFGIGLGSGMRPSVDKVEVESVIELDVEYRFDIGLGSGMEVDMELNIDCRLGMEVEYEMPGCES